MIGDQLADPVDRRRRRGRRLRGAGRHGQALARPAARGRQGPLRLPRRAVGRRSTRSSAERFGLPVEQGRVGRRSCRPAARPTRPGCRAASERTRASRRGAFADRRRRHRRRRRQPHPTRPTTWPTALQLAATRARRSRSRSAATASERDASTLAARRAAARTCAPRLRRLRELVRRARARACASACCRSSGSHAGRAHARRGAGGDVTFAIDAEAEAFLEALRRGARARRGLLLRGPRPGRAGRVGRLVLVVDPIDGTRPAMAGFESACVSRRAAPLARRRADDGRRRRRLRRRDQERRRGSWRCAARACRGRRAGAALEREHGPRPAVLDLRLPRAPGARDRRGARRADRPAPRSAAATFELGSARLRHDARRSPASSTRTSSPGPRLVAEVPGMRAEFERVGGGARRSTTRPTTWPRRPCASRRPAPCMTDAPAAPLRDRPLLGSGAEYPDVVLRRRPNAAAPSMLARGRGAGHGAPRALDTRGRRVNADQVGSPRAPARRRGTQEPGRLHAHRRPAARRGDPRAGRAAARASASCTSRRPRSAAASSEILYTLVPLMRDVGLDAEWQVIYGREEFFNATKLMHNALQGAPAGPHRGAVGDLGRSTTR